MKTIWKNCSVRKIIRDFTRETRGNVAIIFAVCTIPIFLLMGFAIDLQQVNTAKSRVQYLADSAVIAGAREMQEGKSDKKIKAYIANYFASIMKADGSAYTCKAPATTITSSTQDISLKINCQQPTSIMQLMGTKKLDFAVSSASTYGIGKVDIAFVFDVSGSMGGSKIEDLKDAAEVAVNVLLPKDSPLIDTGDVRIGMASYSYLIDAGDYFKDVTNENPKRTYTGTYEKEVKVGTEKVCKRYNKKGKCKKWKTEDVYETQEFTSTYEINNTCVKERLGKEAFTDEDPDHFAWIEPTEAYYNKHSKSWSEDRTCNSPPPLPLTDDRDDLLDYIEDLPANGGTAGHLGIAWGWYLIAPDWKSVWPSSSKPWAYDEPDTAKALIMMTDGDFLNEYNLGEGHGDSFAQSKLLCDNIKKTNINIYTVAFKAPSQGKAILEYCASGPDFAFTPESSDELKDAYTSIAQSISDLRIRY